MSTSKIEFVKTPISPARRMEIWTEVQDGNAVSLAEFQGIAYRWYVYLEIKKNLIVGYLIPDGPAERLNYPMPGFYVAFQEPERVEANNLALSYCLNNVILALAQEVSS